MDLLLFPKFYKIFNNIQSKPTSFHFQVLFENPCSYKKRSGDTTDREFEEFRELEGRELEELDCINFNWVIILNINMEIGNMF